MSRVTYPPNFIARMHETFPGNAEIREMLAKGDRRIGLFLVEHSGIRNTDGQALTPGDLLTYLALNREDVVRDALKRAVYSEALYVEWQRIMSAHQRSVARNDARISSESTRNHRSGTRVSAESNRGS